MYRIGIDEVGRGPLAGPVTVAAVALPSRMRFPQSLGELRDSKKLTRSAREAWAKWIRESLPHAVSRCSAGTVDARGIAVCASTCALRAYTRVAEEVGDAPVRIDGGLYLGSKKRQLAEYPNATTTPKADEDHPEVALASILAKVTRDRMMARYARAYPGYGFEVNAGYGTRSHYVALKKQGPSAIHRLTFLRSLGSMGL